MSQRFKAHVPFAPIRAVAYWVVYIPLLILWTFVSIPYSWIAFLINKTLWLVEWVLLRPLWAGSFVVEQIRGFVDPDLDQLSDIVEEQMPRSRRDDLLNAFRSLNEQGGTMATKSEHRPQTAPKRPPRKRAVLEKPEQKNGDNA